MSNSRRSRDWKWPGDLAVSGLKIAETAKSPSQFRNFEAAAPVNFCSTHTHTTSRPVHHRCGPSLYQSTTTTLELQCNIGSHEGQCQRSHTWNLRSVIVLILLQILSSYATTLVVFRFLVKYAIELSLSLFSLKSVVVVMLLQVSTNHCGHSVQR